MLRFLFLFSGLGYAHKQHEPQFPPPPPSHLKEQQQAAIATIALYQEPPEEEEDDNDDEEEQQLIPSPLFTEVSDGATVRFETNNAQILFNQKPIFIKGVCYSPAPIGVNPVFEAPHGDFFTEEYRPLWERDLPLIKNLGANTIRVYGWNPSSDHRSFLDFCLKHELWVIITFFLGTAEETPVSTAAQEEVVISQFAEQVGRYAGHPAILAWSFGNEINGNWNLFLQAYSDRNKCNWNPGDAAAGQGGCFQSAATTGPCVQPIACVYKGFFSFINEASKRAHAAMGRHSHLIITCFADVDNVLGRISDFENDFAHDLDAWGVQLYRGVNFGRDGQNFLTEFAKVTHKPLIVTEYGVDSYNDKCGFSQDSVCYNFANDAEEAQDIQADWGTKLSQELMSYSSAEGKGSVAGGCIMAWSDEQWKTAVNVKGCSGPRWPSPSFDPSKCEYKAHVDCPNLDITKPALCGYALAAPFDGYVNEGYWGIVQVRPSSVLGGIDVVHPKLLYPALRGIWLPGPGIGWLILAAGVFLLTLLCLLAAFYYHRRLQALDEERRRLVDSPVSGYSEESKSPEMHSGLP